VTYIHSRQNDFKADTSQEKREVDNKWRGYWDHGGVKVSYRKIGYLPFRSGLLHIKNLLSTRCRIMAQQALSFKHE
jgi:hypothetical protein